MKEIIVAAITEGKSPTEAKNYADILKGNVDKQRRKKQQCKRRVVTDEADEEKEMQKILSQFFKDMRKFSVTWADKDANFKVEAIIRVQKFQCTVL